jgi:hypothetical protein
MDKTADRINRQTLDFTNKVYEELSTITHQREGLRYFNYDLNDENIDDKLYKIFDLLGDIYNSCIEKKTGWLNRKPPLKPKKLFPEEGLPNVDIHTPSPRTPVKKKKSKKIKVEVTEDKKELDVLETIMYSSDDENEDMVLSDEESYDKLSDEQLVLAPNYKESDELVFLGLEEDGETEYYEQAGDLGMAHCSWCKKNLPKEDVYKAFYNHNVSYDTHSKPTLLSKTLACKNCIEICKFVKIS